MEEWKEYRYSDLAEIIGGGTPKTTNQSYWNGNIPWLSVKDFGNDNKFVYSTEKTITEEGLNNSSTKLLQQNDIIISARGTVGELAMIPYEMAFNQSCFGLRARNFVLPDFLYYYTKTKIRELKVSAHGSVFDTITRNTFDNLVCKIPSLSVQKQIVSILSSLDDKIECNRKINENLEQQAQALFKSWFGAKTENGDLSIKNLTDIAEYINGLAMQKYPPSEEKEGLPVLKIKELGQKSCDQNSDRCSSQIDSKYIVNDGEIIFSWSGTLLVDLWCGGKCGLNQHLFKVVPKKEYPKWFVYYWTKHHLDKFIRIAKDKAVTMGHIKRGDLEASEVIVPSSEIMKGMNNIMEPLVDAIIKSRLEISRLTQLRDTLLPKLMSGEITIND